MTFAESTVKFGRTRPKCHAIHELTYFNFLAVDSDHVAAGRHADLPAIIVKL
jgi:hypothetical protein